jgi:hypothetical protein
VVSLLMGVVVGLTFLFGFGNVLNLALKLGVPAYVAPLVAPAVDLTVVGLLLGTRHLTLLGADGAVIQPARRLLLGASVVTLALNVADPLLAFQWGKAAFDAVGPLLLIGWSEVGPALLGAMHDVQAATGGQAAVRLDNEASDCESVVSADSGRGDLLVRARVEDARHWAEHRRPISAETLRRSLRVSSGKSRALVATLRSEASRPLAE